MERHGASEATDGAAETSTSPSDDVIGGPRDHQQAEAFARAWIAAWNRKDVEAVLRHFAEDAVFTSPKAALIAGHPILRGKEALRSYWLAASARISRIEFSLDYVLWDGERRELVVVSTADLDGRRNRACEFMRFDEAGQQVAGEAMYGIDLQP